MSLLSRALSLPMLALAAGCARVGAPSALPSNVHLLGASARAEDLCPVRSLCENFRDVPVEEVVRFEERFPAVLKAKGFTREAEQFAGSERFYWAVQRVGGLYIRGTLVCRQRLASDGVVLLEPTCPSIDVTFPAGHPQQVEFVIDSPIR